MIALIATADWYAGNRASLGVLYILPMMMGARVLAPWQTVVLALTCSTLRSVFDIAGSPPVEIGLRFVFASLTYAGSGLFVTALLRNRELEEQLKTLVESSPAAILATDGSGAVLAANRAATAMFLTPETGALTGRDIRKYIPLLGDALALSGEPEQFRTAAQCQGRKDNGDIFPAHVWFSSYTTPSGPRLAAIVVDSSEEMRDREEEGLRQLKIGNRIAAAAVSHEVRNLCSAISLLCSNIQAKHRIGQDEDLQGLNTLAHGLERIASWELQGSINPALEEIALQEVMDDLRIIIEPDWRDFGGAIVWKLPPKMPVVVAERHGLLQAFLNLAQNSHRAVETSPERELRISVCVEEKLVAIRFTDSGPGIAEPDRLFAPFQPGANGSGLGLYVSRAVVRSYGGDLRFEPQTGGACFRVEIPIV
ncbi:MAG: PAS domain-containing sensor histidine kinase [Terriglobia bacterium]|nr:MAG: PAS domain-containing sensor histidine kinase [Terriglobia bacterium]